MHGSVRLRQHVECFFPGIRLSSVLLSCTQSQRLRIPRFFALLVMSRAVVLLIGRYLSVCLSVFFLLSERIIHYLSSSQLFIWLVCSRSRILIFYMDQWPDSYHRFEMPCLRYRLVV